MDIKPSISVDKHNFISSAQTETIYCYSYTYLVLKITLKGF